MILKDAEGNYEIILEDEKTAVQHGSEETHYTVIESSGEVENRGYCVLNNIYVNEGMESPFEARFLNRQSNLSSVDGFKAHSCNEGSIRSLLRHSDLMGG